MVYWLKKLIQIKFVYFKNNILTEEINSDKIFTLDMIY